MDEMTRVHDFGAFAKSFHFVMGEYSMENAHKATELHVKIRWIAVEGFWVILRRILWSNETYEWSKYGQESFIYN